MIPHPPTRAIALLALPLLAPAAGRAQATTAEPNLSIELYAFVTDAGDTIPAELGRFEVAEDHDRPDGRTIELAFVRFPATGPDPGSPIVYLAGGPGGSGIEIGRGPRGELFQALRGAGDVVLLDQRGTGLSRPVLGCPNMAVMLADEARTPESSLARLRAVAADCAERWRSEGVDLSAWDTEASADDLEALRRALGAERLRLVGMSYGTHLALATIRRHGEWIERAVLAGIEGMDDTLKLPSRVQANLERVGELVAADPGWGERIPDLAGLVSRRAGRLDRSPVTVALPSEAAGDGRPRLVRLSGLDVRQLAGDLASRRRSIPEIPALFGPAAVDDFTPLARVARSALRSARLSAMALAMDCASGVSPERLEMARREAPMTAVGTALDFPFPDFCDAVGVPDLGAAFRAPVRSEVPVLFLSGTLDGRTPAANAEEVLAGFPRGVHVVVENTGHDHELLMGSPQIVATIVGFLMGETPAADRLPLPPVELGSPDVIPPPAAPVMAKGALALVGATLIDGTGGPARADMTVVVRDGRIAAVGPAEEVQVPADAARVEAREQTLIPGLWDMHAHLTKIGPTALPLFLANGVTGVRDMGSDFAEVARLRGEIAAAARLGPPRIFTSGPILESAENVERMHREQVVEPFERVRAPVADPADAARVVDSIAALGVDYLKIRTFASPETFAALAAAARRVGLPLVGHTFGLTPELILESGMKSIEHVMLPLLDDRTEAERLTTFRRLAEAGVAMVTTGVVGRESLFLPLQRQAAVVADSAGEVDTRRRYVSEWLLADWREQLAERQADPQDLSGIAASAARNLQEMRRVGMRILPGTDSGVLLIYPGFHLHDELELLVERAGMTPMEALIAATRSSAEYLGAADSTGTIEEGKVADLVLLDADPLADIRNTKRIAGVVAAGRWYDRAGLDAMLEAVAEAVRR